MFLHLISRLKNDLTTPDELEATARDDFYKRLVSIWRAYQKILVDSRAVDFDDLLLNCVKLLSLPQMREKMKGKYNYVLVDEYQDTNKVQFLLTKLLATNPDGLMVVGDAAQAIYSFRGADFRNLSLLASEYPNLKTIRLPKNYRSTQTILDAAFGVIGNNTKHPVIKLESIKEFGEKISLAEMIDEKEEAAYVVRVATKLATKGGSLAVLYRTNAQSRAIEEALIRAKIDYKLVGGIRFYDRAEIKDLLAYLRVIFNEVDSVSEARIEKLGKRNKIKFEEWLAGSKSRMLTEEPDEILAEVMEQTGYLTRFDERDEDDAARVENIRELTAVASQFRTLTEFLESVALIQSDEIAQKQSGDTLVTMMTIHSAKGLEFDEVIIVGLEEGLLPHSRSLLEKDELEEERRLMYVAMTRARDKLHLTLTRSRLVFGGRQASSPSRFLSEIPQELIKIASEGLSYRDLEDRRREDDGWDKRRIVPEWESEPTSLKLRRPRGDNKPDRDRVLRESQKDFDDIDAW
jgi:DNA helicase-2/ATP-dependent DNA helicase PcrA